MQIGTLGSRARIVNERHNKEGGIDLKGSRVSRVSFDRRFCKIQICTGLT